MRRINRNGVVRFPDGPGGFSQFLKGDHTKPKDYVRKEKKREADRDRYRRRSPELRSEYNRIARERRVAARRALEGSEALTGVPTHTDPLRAAYALSAHALWEKYPGILKTEKEILTHLKAVHEKETDYELELMDFFDKEIDLEPYTFIKTDLNKIFKRFRKQKGLYRYSKEGEETSFASVRIRRIFMDTFLGRRVRGVTKEQAHRAIQFRRDLYLEARRIRYGR